MLIIIILFITDKKPELDQLYSFEYEENGETEKIEIIPMLAKKWKVFGVNGLGLRDFKVETCQGENVVDSCYQLFQLFLNDGSKKFKSPTWKSIVQAMRDSGFSVPADDLEKALPRMKK